MTLGFQDNQGHQALDAKQHLDHLTGNSIVSGVQPSAGTGLEVSVSSGTALVDGSEVSVSSQTVSLDAADSDNPRKDVITVDSTGSLVKYTGSPESVAPEGSTGFDTQRPAPQDLNEVSEPVVAEVYVAAGASSLSASDIRDRRVVPSVYAGSLTSFGDIDVSGTTVYDSSNSWVPQAVLENDTITVDGTDVSLGGSVTVDTFSGSHQDLSNINSDDHHVKTTSLDDITDDGALASLDSVDTSEIADSAVTEGKLAFDPATQSELDNHTGDTSNPHSVTASQADAVPSSDVGSANGVASLNADTEIPSEQIPPVALSEIYVVADTSERDNLAAEEGDVAKVTGEDTTYIYDGSSWIEMSTDAPVDSVNGYTGTVSLDTDDVSEAGNLYYTDTRVSNYLSDNSYTQEGDDVSVFNNDSGYITDYTVTESDVTSHEAALNITEDQISDLSHVSVSDDGSTVLSSPDDINYGGSFFDVSDDGDGTVSVSLTDSAVGSSAVDLADDYTWNGAHEFDGGLTIGTFEVDQDSGPVQLINMPVSDGPGQGSEQSISIGLDSVDQFTVYGEADGSGGTQNVHLDANGNVIKNVGSPSDGSDVATVDYVDNNSSSYTDSDAIDAVNNDSDHGSTASHNYFSGDYSDLSNVSVTVSDIDGAAFITSSEGIGSNDNDTSFPSSAAVKSYVDNNSSTGTGVSDDGTEVVSSPTDINYASQLSVTDDGDDTVTVDVDTNSSYTLPSSDGSSGQVLKTDGSGNVSFQADSDTTYSAGSGVNLSSGSFSLDESYGASWSSTHTFENGLDIEHYARANIGHVSLRTSGTSSAMMELRDETNGRNLMTASTWNGAGHTKVDFPSGIMVSDTTIEEVAEPQNSSDAATMNYVDTSVFSGSYTDLTNVPSSFTPESHGNEAHDSTFATETYVDNNSGGEKVAYEPGMKTWPTGFSDDVIHRFDNPNGDFSLEKLEFPVKGGGSADAELKARLQKYALPEDTPDQSLAKSGDTQSIEFSPDMSYMAYTEYGEVNIYNVSDWSLETTLTSAGDDVNEIAWNDNYIFCASTDNNLYVHNISDWSLATTLSEVPDGTNGLTCVALNNNYVAYGAYNEDIYVHNISDWSLETTLSDGDSSSTPYDVLFMTDYIAYGLSTNEVRIHNLSDWSLNTTLTEPGDTVNSLDADENYAVCGVDDGEVKVYDVNDWSLIDTLTDANDIVESVEISQDSKYLATGGYDNNVYLYSTSEWAMEKTLTEAGGSIFAVEWSNEYFVYGGDYSSYYGYGDNIFIHNRLIPSISVSAGSSDNTGYTITEDPVKIRITTNEEVTGTPIVRGELK